MRRGRGNPHNHGPPACNDLLRTASACKLHNRRPPGACPAYEASDVRNLADGFALAPPPVATTTVAAMEAATTARPSPSPCAFFFLSHRPQRGRWRGRRARISARAPSRRWRSSPPRRAPGELRRDPQPARPAGLRHPRAPDRGDRQRGRDGGRRHRGAHDRGHAGPGHPRAGERRVADHRGLRARESFQLGGS